MLGAVVSTPSSDPIQLPVLLCPFRPLIPAKQQLEYDWLQPSRAGERMRLVTLQRHSASDGFGFAVRGGKYSTGCQLEAVVCDASCPNNMSTACLNLLCSVSDLSHKLRLIRACRETLDRRQLTLMPRLSALISHAFFRFSRVMLHKHAPQSLAPRTASALTICNLHVEEEKKQLRLSRAMFITPFCPRTAPWDRTLVRCTRQITSLSLINYLAPPDCCLCALPVVDSCAVLSGYQFDLSLS